MGHRRAPINTTDTQKGRRGARRGAEGEHRWGTEGVQTGGIEGRYMGDAEGHRRTAPLIQAVCVGRSLRFSVDFKVASQMVQMASSEQGITQSVDGRRAQQRWWKPDGARSIFLAVRHIRPNCLYVSQTNIHQATATGGACSYNSSNAEEHRARTPTSGWKRGHWPTQGCGYARSQAGHHLGML